MINWAEDSKRKDIADLIQLANKEKNPLRRAYILQVIDKTKRDLEAENMCDFVSTVSSNNKFLSLLEENISLGRYYSLLAAFSSIYEDYEMVTQLNIETINTFDLTEFDKKISDEEAFTLVHDFYLGTDDKFRKLFSKYINEKYTTIKFSKDERLLDEYDCDGLNFFIDILMKNYILVRDKGGYAKSILLAHEIGHALAFLFHPKSLYTFQDTFLNELPSLFFELAFTDEVIRKKSGIIGAEHLISVLENMTTDIDYMLLHDTILEEWKLNNYKVNNDLYRNIKAKNGLCKNVVLESIRTSITDEGGYVFSYIIALYLLKIYRQDKKEALKLLRIVLKMHQEDSLLVFNSVLPDLNEVRTELQYINDTATLEVQKVLK